MIIILYTYFANHMYTQSNFDQIFFLFLQVSTCSRRLKMNGWIAYKKLWKIVKMAEEEDVYVSQLKEVFESCDLTGKGFLNRSELIDLCQRLQLDDQIPAILNECIGDEVSDGEVHTHTYFS